MFNATSGNEEKPKSKGNNKGGDDGVIQLDANKRNKSHTKKSKGGCDLL